MEGELAREKKGTPCPSCGNRLRVRPDQAGSQVICPKCNATFTVGGGGAAKAPTPSTAPRPTPEGDLYEPERSLAPPAQKAAKSPVTPAPANALSVPTLTVPPEEGDPYEPERPLTPSWPVPVEQMVDLSASANQQAASAADWSTGESIDLADRFARPAIEHDYLADAKERGLLRTEPNFVIPKWTFLSGVFSFPWRGPNLVRWIGMSLGMVVSGECLVLAVDGLKGGVNVSSLGTPFIMVATAVTTLVALLFTAPCFIAAIEDTADGYDEVQESTLPPWDQWVITLGSLWCAWMLSGALGMPLSIVPEVGALAIPLSLAVFFPIVVLSALECESFLVPYSPAVLGTLGRSLRSWLGFYVVSALVVGAWVALADALLPQGPHLAVVLLAPTLAAVVLIYARLLGRLGWAITRTPGDERPRSATDNLEPATSGKKKKRRIAFPEDLDAGAEMLAHRRPPR